MTFSFRIASEFLFTRVFVLHVGGNISLISVVSLKILVPGDQVSF